MHINISFIAGFLSYGLLEFLIVVLVVRYFPSKTSRLYGIGAAIQRIFAKKLVFNDIPEEEPYDEDQCDCPMCHAERAGVELETELETEPLPIGAEVIVNDDNESYEVCVSTIKDIAEHPDGVQYWVGSGEVLAPVDSEDAAYGYELIPEGAAVRFAMPTDNGSWGQYRTGVTFKAIVREGELSYAVEYPVEGDVEQVEVPASDVWIRTPEEIAKDAAAEAHQKEIEADIAKDGYDEPPVFATKEEGDAWVKTPIGTEFPTAGEAAASAGATITVPVMPLYNPLGKGSDCNRKFQLTGGTDADRGCSTDPRNPRGT